MRAYKNIIIFSIAWIAFFFITEFIMDIIFEDSTPLWKILAISLISGAGVLYPFLKDGKNFTTENVRKKQMRHIELSYKYNNLKLRNNISTMLEFNKFKIISSDFAKIKVKSKWNINSFDETYIIYLNDRDIIIKSKVSFNIIPFDGGIRYNNVDLIKTKISQLLNTTKLIRHR